MATLRRILSQSGERDNLRTVLLCALLVVLITAIGFWAASITYDIESVQGAARSVTSRAEETH